MIDYRRFCYFKVVKIMQIVCHLVMDIVSITFLAIQPMVTALVVVHPDMLDLIATKVRTHTFKQFDRIYIYITSLLKKTKYLSIQCSRKSFTSFKLVLLHLNLRFK